MKILLIMTTIFLTSISFAKLKQEKVCEPCAKAIALEKKIADSKIVPDQMNAKTINMQDKFVGDSAEAIQKILKLRPFEKEHARSVLKLLSRIACFYDNQGDIPGLNRDIFKAIYDTRNNVLKTELALMIKSGEITEKRSKAMLEAIGAIEAADHIPAGCTDYK
ncbi:hypothetical protein K2X05_13970 [bacterium]|nr:hypothetical protein [bacterium]